MEENSRKEIHAKFWTMNYEARRAFASACMTKAAIKRKRDHDLILTVNKGTKERSGSWEYHLEGIKVCQTMFIYTLGLTIKKFRSMRENPEQVKDLRGVHT